MIKEMIKKLVRGENLSYQESRDMIDFFAADKATQSQIGAFLTAITMKKPTAEEMTGLASRMREKALIIKNDYENLADSCGTGGDEANTFNISTASSILASSSGLKVAKHSNFGVTSRCGSSNVVESLGIKLVKTPDAAFKQLEKNNITFIHSPYFHKCTASVSPARKEIGIRTVFNFLGPLVNPAFPTGQIIGVASLEMCPIIIEVLKNLGVKKALVVNGLAPALDEISICSKTKVFCLENGVIDNFFIEPEDFGIKRAKIAEIKGFEPKENAVLIRKILEGKVTGACLDVVALNTAGLLWAGDVVESLSEGVKCAYELISSGKGEKQLLRIVG